jgi:hypothetical protein
VLALELGALGLLGAPLLGLAADVSLGFEPLGFAVDVPLGLLAALLCPVSSTSWPTLPFKLSVLPVKE